MNVDLVFHERCNVLWKLNTQHLGLEIYGCKLAAKMLTTLLLSYYSA